MAKRDFHSGQHASAQDSRRDDAARETHAQRRASGEPVSQAAAPPKKTEPENRPEAAPPAPLSPENNASSPQLPASGRVEKSMATLAFDPAKHSLRASRGTQRRRAKSATAGQLDEDSAVMLRVQSGDEGAFHTLVEKYHRPIIHYMYRMTHNQAVAEELAQEAFLRVYRSRQSYRAEARFSTWLYRIATNLGVNYARDTRHERAAHMVYLDEKDPETGTKPDVADYRPGAEQNLVRKERMQAIRQHVMALPERQRNAVLMHKYQGLDYRQIGEVLQLSESATKSLLFRAYQTLRGRLKEFIEEN